MVKNIECGNGKAHQVRESQTLDSPAIKAAKAKANDTDYVRKYGVDKTYWAHFLDWQDATAADYTVAIDLITSKSPEATTFIAHLLAMRDIAS